MICKGSGNLEDAKKFKIGSEIMILVVVIIIIIMVIVIIDNIYWVLLCAGTIPGVGHIRAHLLCTTTLKVSSVGVKIQIQAV